MAIISKRSFQSGELSPDFYARVDSLQYATGLRTCRNAWVRKAGGVENRPGTEWVGQIAKRTTAFTAEDSDTREVRLIEFVFDKDNAYVLELTYGSLRFIKNGDYIYEASQNITSITGTTTFNLVGHGYSNDDEVKITITDSTGTWSRNGRIKSSAANTFEVAELVDDTTRFGSSSFISGSVKRIYRRSFGFSDGGTIAANVFYYRFSQSGNSMIFTHKWGGYELIRVTDTNWTLTSLTSFTPAQVPPTGMAVSTVGTGAVWVATAVSSTTGEESLNSVTSAVAVVPTSGAPATVSWVAAAGAGSYNVYRSDGGLYGYVGTSTITSFIDRGYTPNTNINPPAVTVHSGSALNYYTAVAHYQQRLVYGNYPSNVEEVAFSQLGIFKNFTRSYIGQDDQSFKLTLVSRRLNAIQHLVDLNRLVALTSFGETIVNSQEQAVVPTTISPKTQSYNGASYVRPIVIDDSALYIQARGNSLRDLAFDYQVEGYRGNDISFTAKHLFEGKTIGDLAFQQIPHSIAWLVRSDGVLLGVTYVKEQQIIGWHRHDFQGGVVESVAVVPEGNEDVLYVAVKRTVDGTTVRYVERLTSRYFEAGDIEDVRFMDSNLTYDGTNTTATTMTLSGSGWTSSNTLTLTASASFFLSSDVGNEIHFTDSNGDPLRFVIEGYTSATVVTGKPHRTVPAELQATATTTWAKAVDQVTGLWHLEGQDVSVFADGLVEANPNNPSMAVVTVTNGTATLSRCYAVIHVGLPYLSDIETLDVDVSNGPTRIGEGKLVGKAIFQFSKTRGVFVGPEAPEDDDTDPIGDLEEMKIRNAEDYDDPVALTSVDEEVILRPEWNTNGRVFVRQIDPLPMTILSVHGEGIY